MQLENTGILVTGGASGLGAACVKLLIQSGAKVTIASRNAEIGSVFAEKFKPAAQFIKTDITNEMDVQTAIRATINKFGALQVVINCAGIGYVGKVVERGKPGSLTSFSKVVQVNLIGTYNVIRLATTAMIENQPNADGERGVIINTASVAAFDGQIGQSAYAASESGIVGMTLPISRELARYGIRVMTVAPGVFDTPMTRGLPEFVRTALAQQTPSPPRLGRPEEYATLAKHIIENTMLNGEVIRLDGSIRLPYLLFN